MKEAFGRLHKGGLAAFGGQTTCVEIIIDANHGAGHLRFDFHTTDDPPSQGYLSTTRRARARRRAAPLAPGPSWRT